VRYELAVRYRAGEPAEGVFRFADGSLLPLGADDVARLNQAEARQDPETAIAEIVADRFVDAMAPEASRG
jgi:hypothetical protein